MEKKMENEMETAFTMGNIGVIYRGTYTGSSHLGLQGLKLLNLALGPKPYRMREFA